MEQTRTRVAPPFDIVAVGELNPDLILACVDAEEPRLGTEQVARQVKLTLGSSAAICLVGARRLGLSTALVAKTGQDFFGEFCRQALEGEGVDTRFLLHDPKYGTGLTAALTYPSDRLLVTHLGAMAHLAAKEVPELSLRQTRHMHVTSLYLQHALAPQLASVLSAAKSYGVTTSLDTGWDPMRQWPRKLLEPLLEFLDLMLPNEAEVLALSGQDSAPDAAAWLLDRGVGRIVVKRGPAGATSFDGDGQVEHPGFTIDPVDTTGAGDSFNAGYLYGFLKQLDERERLRLANACGALAAGTVGGTGGFGSLSEVYSFVEEQESSQSRDSFSASTAGNGDC